MKNQHKTTELIEKVLNGNVDCFEEIIDSHKAMVFGIIRLRIPAGDVQDVAQDTFVDVFKSLAGYSRKGSFSGWVRSICMRRCCDYWRRHEKEKSTMSIDSLETQQLCIESFLKDITNSNFDKSKKKQDAKEAVEYLMAKLSAEDRTLIDMLYFQDMKLREAALALNWGLAKCKVRSMRARGKMRKIIAEHLRAEL